MGKLKRLISGDHTYGSVSEKISSIVLTTKTPAHWFLVFGVSFSLVGLLTMAIGYLFIKGVGIWGINIPVGWGFAIINFVWWVGIGHAGTLISAILLLLNQKWRTSINRFAETMTLFAVSCAGVFPLIHIGRPWLAYWLMPYPNTMDIWPQFRSPLIWDVFAVSTYATISALFWYVGLIPDLAGFRDRAKNRFGQIVYGMMAMGWRGSARHWQRYESAYLLLAGLATPLVISVHTIVSWDFAVSVLPGWHSTIFPPYFVAGAVFSGFAMVLTLAIPLRKFYGLKDLITDRHLNNMAKILLATGLIVCYGYLVENFTAWYSGSEFERGMVYNRLTGPYAPLFYLLLIINIGVPQLLWSKKIRTNGMALFIISILVNVGMWLERFIIVVTSLAQDFLPSSWGLFVPTFWDWATYLGTLGLFFFLMILFIRFMPVISIFETKELLMKEKKSSGSAV